MCEEIRLTQYRGFRKAALLFLTIHFTSSYRIQYVLAWPCLIRQSVDDMI